MTTRTNGQNNNLQNIAQKTDEVKGY